MFAIPMLRLTSLPEDVLRIIFELVGPPDLCSMRATCRCLCEGMPADHPLLVLRQKEWQSGLVTNPAMGDLRSRAASIEEYAEALVRNSWKQTETLVCGASDVFRVVNVSETFAVYVKEREGNVEVNVWCLPSKRRGVAGKTWTWLLPECPRVGNIWQAVVDDAADIVTFLIIELIPLRKSS